MVLQVTEAYPPPIPFDKAEAKVRTAPLHADMLAKALNALADSLLASKAGLETLDTDRVSSTTRSATPEGISAPPSPRPSP